MTRHSKNATAGPSYTYHEKQKDSKQSGYGSTDVRMSKDAIKEFDCCSLSLQPCRNPVITPDGFIYDKEAIIEYILHQKADISRKLKQFEQYKHKEDKDLKELADIEAKDKIEKFLKTEGKFVSSSSDKSDSTATSSVSNMNAAKGSKLPSFWIPSLSPASKVSEVVKKPDTKVYCPMSGRPISLKDLIDVKFKLLDEKDKKALIAKNERYVCAITNDVLGNSVPCVVLKPSGAVVTAECVEKLIRKDMIDPISGQKLSDSDIIPIKRGGTGFSGSGVQLVSKKITPAMIS